jgi:hypothetical protein
MQDRENGAERRGLCDQQEFRARRDWLAEAGGFEPLHCRIEIREDSQPGRQDSNIRISIEVCRAAPHSQRKSQAMIDSSGSDSEMQRFESSRLKRPVSV